MSRVTSSTRFIDRPLTRRTVATGIFAGSVAALAGCSSAGSSSDSGTITFLSWDNEPTMKPVIAAFEKANPKYTIKATYVPPVPQYIQALQTRLGAGTAPDVFIITAENKHPLMDNKLTLDLSGESWAGNLASAAKETYTQDGKLYGAAVSSWGGGLLLNTKLVEKAGYSAPPTTWTEFLDLLKKIKSTGVTPFYEAGDGLSITLAALLGLRNEELGGTMDKDIWSGKTTFAAAWTPALELWNQLFTSGAESRVVAGLTGTQVSEQFQKGKVAITSTGSWGLPPIKQAAPDLDLEFVAVPGASSTYWCGAVSPGYAVNAKAKNQKGGLAFLNFLQSVKGVEPYQKATAAITTTKDYTPTLDKALDAMVPDVRAGKFYLPVVTWPSNNDVLGTQSTALLQQMIQGKLTPAAVAKGMDDKLQSVL